MKQKYGLILLAIFTLASAGVIFALNQGGDTQESDPVQNIVENENGQFTDDQTPNDESDVETPTTEQDEEPQKVSEQPSTSQRDVEIVTSAGTNQDRPVASGKPLSTICTADPNVTCTISFTNVNTNKTLSFDVTTDEQGAGVLSWTSGETIPSGTWTVVAMVGDKQSNQETVYIQ